MTQAQRHFAGYYILPLKGALDDEALDEDGIEGNLASREKTLSGDTV